jgi:hypothetical protein
VASGRSGDVVVFFVGLKAAARLSAQAAAQQSARRTVRRALSLPVGGGGSAAVEIKTV